MIHPFTHLRVHSEYSIVDSTIRLSELVSSCANQGMPAVALTDEMNLCALVKFYNAAYKQGIKPILGVDVYVARGSMLLGKATLLIKHFDGFTLLSSLLSEAWINDRVQGQPAIAEQRLLDRPKGLIALIGGHQNLLHSAQPAEQSQTLTQWKNAFQDNLYLEIQRVNRDNEAAWTATALQLAQTHDIPLAATNDVRFISSADYNAHEARVGIQRNERLGSEILKQAYTDQQSLKSPGEMSQIFADIPSALTNTWSIAQRCNLQLNLHKPQLPRCPIDTGETEAESLRITAEQGLKARLGDASSDVIERYKKRLFIELDVILSMGFEGYFLIVYDFIIWAKKQSIAVGPGRGSGAGSLVAFALRITDVDPLKYNLLFERFLNPERISMPDFDIDFCMERRDEVIQYVVERYGTDQVAQIITFGTMAAKAAVRDAARVMSMPPFVGDRIAKMIPNELGITLSSALEKNSDLYEAHRTDSETRDIYTLALKLEGLIRNAGKHAGGVVIAPSALSNFSPLYKDESDNGSVVTQLDKNDVEAMGLVKFDFLGLRTLTIIQWALELINEQSPDSPIDINDLSYDDPAVYRLLQKADTLAVFQCESPGIKTWMRKMEPSCFEDIIALVALYRPGPLGSGMVDDFINRKKGIQEINYLHPLLEPVLKETYGVFLYQEQVMQCAQVLAGYSLGEADLLRRAMGKKDTSIMAQQEALFINRSSEKHQLENALARQIFDLMAEFAEYGFNKSHSAAYAILTYQTAWLKTHYPAAFYAAVMNSEIDSPERINTIVNDCTKHQINVLPPNVQHSKSRFTVNKQNDILWGLAAIKGFGKGAAQAIESISDRPDIFDFYDFCSAVEISKIGKRGLEYLILSGSMDCFQHDRAVLLATIPQAYAEAEQRLQDQKMGQNSLFGDTSVERCTELTYAKVSPMPLLEKLHREKALTGKYLSGHPINFFLPDLQHCSIPPVSHLVGSLSKKSGRSGRTDHRVWLAGEVEISQIRMTKSNRKMINVRLGDGLEHIEARLSEEQHTTLKTNGDMSIGKIWVVQGTAQFDRRLNEWQIKAEEVLTLSQMRQRFYQHVELTWRSDLNTNESVQQLLQLKQVEGIKMSLLYQSQQATARCQTPYALPYNDEAWLQLNGLTGCSLSVKLTASDHTDALR